MKNRLFVMLFCYFVMIIFPTIVKAEDGTVSVSGIGNSYYYVYDSEGTQVGSDVTGQKIEIAPGTYAVKLNNIVESATVEAGKETVLESGSLKVSGTGNDFYYVYDSEGTTLDYEQTDNQIDLFPGTYTIKLNKSAKSATVEAGKETVLESGTVSVSGTEVSFYYVYDSEGTELSSSSTGSQIELFPGTYTVKLNKVATTATVKVGEETVLETGTVSVVNPNGFDHYYFYDLKGNELVYATTEDKVDMLPGTYILSVDDKSLIVDVVKGDNEFLVDDMNVTIPMGTKLSAIYITDPSSNLGLVVTNADSEKHGSDQQQAENMPLDIEELAEKNCSKSGVTDWKLLQECVINETSVIRETAMKSCMDNGIVEPEALMKCTIQKAAERTCSDAGFTDSTQQTACVEGIKEVEEQYAEEVLAIYGDKNLDGYLLNVEKVVLASSSIPANSMQINFGDDFFPSSIEYSDGTKINIQEYNVTDSQITDITIETIDKNGNSTIEQIEFSDQTSSILFLGREAVQNYVDFQIQNASPGFPSSGSTGCKGTMAGFLKVTDELVWGVSQMSSIIGCMTGSVWACGSAVLTGINAIGNISTGGKSPLNEVNEINSAAQFIDNISKLNPLGIATGTYSLLRKSGAFTPESICDSLEAISNGDPHLFTFDKLAYDFQAAGEFIFTKSLNPDEPFEIQVRQKAWKDHDNIAITQAVAMNVEGDRVGIYSGHEEKAYINGTLTQLTESDMVLPAGGGIKRDGRDYTIIWPTSAVLVKVRDTSLGLLIQVYLDKTHSGHLIGLLGNADGNEENDIVTRDGVDLGTGPSHDVLYTDFADSWRISQEESLFDYDSGETTETFTDRNFPRNFAQVSDLTEEEKNNAEQICLQAGISNPTVLNNCILDVGLTNEPGFAELPPELAKSQVPFITYQTDDNNDTAGGSGGGGGGGGCFIHTLDF